MKLHIADNGGYRELRQLTWDIVKEDKGRFTNKHCDNIITFDIEASNGYRQPDNTVIGFNKELYDKHPEFYGVATKEIQKHYGDIEQVGMMYVWQCAIDAGDDIHVFIGRRWSVFDKFLTELAEDVLLCSNRRKPDVDGRVREMCLKSLTKVQKPEIHIYIHNLPYEFQYLRTLYNAEFAKFRKRPKVFARQSRSPMKASITSKMCKITFHDSYVLTQKSLAAWCEDAALEVQKLEEPEGFYDPVRTPNTTLTDEEIKYCINDVVSMVYGLRKYKEKYLNIYNIVMTQTGEIRRKLKTKVANENKEWAVKCAEFYRSLDIKTYTDLQAAFLGGWTHANAIYTGRKMENIKCFDFRSSYPAVMCSCKFPVGTWKHATYDFAKEMATLPYSERPYAYYIRAKFYDVKSKMFNSFWSESKCVEGSMVYCTEERNGREVIKKGTIDNGKIHEIKEMEAVMTDRDFERFLKCYDCKVEPIYVKISELDYLPKEMIMLILDYYGYKTSLKGCEDKKSLYAESKQFINSIYGVMVYKEFSDEIQFNGTWDLDEIRVELDEFEFEKQRLKMATKKDLFGMYSIGVWVTAHARNRLWDAIDHFDFRVVYCDTDSIKGKFTDEDLKWFDEYNARIDEECAKCAAYYNIPLEKYHPKTPKGVCKELGYFDREDDCLAFKTLGAKRYVDVINKDGEEVLQATIAGLPKDMGVKKLMKAAHGNPFKAVDKFKDKTVWDAHESGKLTAYYNDDQEPMTWIDRDGNKYESTDRYGICLMPTSFDLSITEEYQLFCDIIQHSPAYAPWTDTKIFRKVQ